jgi:hypothetical protein
VPASGLEIAPAGGVAANEPPLGVVLKNRIGEVLGADAKGAAGRRRPRGAIRLGAESFCASAGSAARRVNSTFHGVSHGGDQSREEPYVSSRSFRAIGGDKPSSVRFSLIFYGKALRAIKD